MKKFYAFLFSVLLTTPIFAFAASVDSGLNFSQLERIVGVHGVYDAKQQLLKISVPRSDLNVTINGIKLSTAMGLTSWVTFKKVNATTTELAGSLALTEDQINQVMQTAIDNHLDVVELHNHLLWESPKIMFMHIEAVGDAKELAAAVNKVFAKIRESSNGNGDFPVGEIDTSVSTFDKVELEKILGAKGQTVDGVYKINVDKQPLSIPSDDIAYISRVNIAATFAGNAENAVVDGDFALQEPNLQKVLTALHQAGVTVVAINQRLVGDNTNYVFLHYWAMGKPLDIARGLRRALDISQEVPAKIQLSKTELVQPYDPINTLATDQNAHMPSPYVHLRALIKQRTLPRFALEPVFETPQLPPVPANLHWSLGKPSSMVSRLWDNLGVVTTTTPEVITDNDMSLGTLLKNSFSALKANLKASALANQEKSFHWTMAKPSQMVTTLWKEWSERPDLPDEPVATTRKTIILGAAEPKPIVLHRDIGKPSEFVHKLWAEISERPEQPDNVLQYTFKSIRRPAAQEIVLHKSIGKPSEYVQHLWFDLANRKVEMPTPVIVAINKTPRFPMALHKDIGKPTQYVEHLWFDLAHRKVEAPLVKTSILVELTKPTGIPIALHKDICKPSQYVDHLWFSFAQRYAVTPLPVAPKEIIVVQKMPVTHATLALQKYLGKDNKIVKHFTYALGNVTTHRELVVMPTVITAKANLPRINLHRELIKPSQFVAHMWFDLANRKVPIAPVTIVTAKVSNIPVILHKDIGKPSQYVEHLWFDLAHRKTHVPFIAPEVLAAGNKLMNQSGVYLTKSAKAIGHYWFDLAKSEMPAPAASVKPAPVIVKAAVPYVSANIHKELGKPSQYIEHLWSNLANRKVETTTSSPVIVKASTPYVSANMHKEIGKPSEYVSHLWQDLATRKTIQVKALQANTNASVQAEIKEQPVLTPVELKHLGKPSAVVHHLWQHLEVQQPLPQQAAVMPARLPMFNKIFLRVARGVQEHQLQVQTRTIQHAKINNAASLVHRLWQTMETPPAAPKPINIVQVMPVTPHVPHPFVSISARKKYFQLKTLMQNPLFPEFANLPVVHHVPHNYVATKTRQPAPAVQHVAARQSHGLPLKPIAATKSHGQVHVTVKKPHQVQAKLKTKTKHTIG